MSLAVRIIPCLDVRGGRVVKGINFKDIVDAGDPAEAAKRYDAEGADEICMLDIDASFEERSTTIETVKSIASQVFIPFTVGGGIKSLKDIDMLLKSGADKVSINTSAILNPELIEEASKEYGAQCIVLAIDAKQDGEIWNVYTHGGKNKTELDAIEWAKKGQDLGAGEILMTSMDKDGTKSGFDNNLYMKLSNNLSIPVIASGGAGELPHLVDAVKLGKADALLAASIFHYEEISIKKVKQALQKEGFEVRL
jgi:cyclase